MILIDNKHLEAYSNVSKSAAARIVGVSLSTIIRWEKKKEIEKYNYWTIYFKENRLKQRKGFAIKSKVISYK